MEEATARIGGVPVRIKEVFNPATCPASHLPWLAWALSVDTWDSNWTDTHKRAAIHSSIYVHRHKGTVGAVKAALAALGYRVSVIEWFTEVPAATPYTFSLDIEVSDRGISDHVYVEAERVALATKNARSHLTRVRAIARSDSALFVGAAITVGEIVEVMPYQLSNLSTNALTYLGACLASYEATTIFPGGI